MATSNIKSKMEEILYRINNLGEQDEVVVDQQLALEHSDLLVDIKDKLNDFIYELDNMDEYDFIDEQANVSKEYDFKQRLIIAGYEFYGHDIFAPNGCERDDSLIEAIDYLEDNKYHVLWFDNVDQEMEGFSDED
jgi:hypothetical protein